MEKEPESQPPPLVVNVDSVTELEWLEGEHWGSMWKPMTPALD